MPYKDRIVRLEYAKKWYAKNKKHIQKYWKEYNTANRENLSIYTKKYRIKNPWLNSYTSAEQRCNNKNHHCYHRYGGRGIKFIITKEEFKVLWNRDKASRMKWPTIDRINNNGNYEFSNCRFIEMSENSKKGSK